jgi:chorismate mutase
MAITEQRTPYEFLARWDDMTGQFKGAHIQYFDSVLKDGQRVAGSASKAFGVGEGMAFPLNDIINQMHVDALAELDVRATAIAAHLATIAARDATITTLTSERDAALARVAELEAQLATSTDQTHEAAVKAERDRRVLGGVKVGDDWFDTTLQTQIQYIGMIMMGSQLSAQTPLWTLDGRNVGATPQRVQQIFANSAQLQAQLYSIAAAAIAADTPLDQIQWPETFAG